MVGIKIATVLATAGILAFSSLSVRAEDEKNPALAKALSEATVSLDEALKASEREGRPLSAKYEIENGAFQLSVYVAKGNGFAEVIVDHKGGSIKKTEPITEAYDLEQAKEQQQRLAHARIPLDRAVTDAVKDNSGYRAVEIEPTVDRAGKPVASVTLMKGDEVKKVVEPLECAARRSSSTGDRLARRQRRARRAAIPGRPTGSDAPAVNRSGNRARGSLGILPPRR